MNLENGESVEISFTHLFEHDKNLTTILSDSPTLTLKIFDIALYDRILELFPEYGSIKEEVKARLIDVPVHDTLRDLR